MKSGLQKTVEEIISKISERDAPNEVAYEIHCVLCPGEPRPKP